MLGETGSNGAQPSGASRTVNAPTSVPNGAAMARNSAAAQNWSNLAIGLDLATMCNWYEFNQSLFHHQWAAAFEYKAAVAAASVGAIYPASAKRRKTDSLTAAASSCSHSQAEMTRLKKRGHVTFKPYNTEETSRVTESLYLSHFRCHPYATIYGALGGSVSESESRRRPLKRKLGASSNGGDSLNDDDDSYDVRVLEVEEDHGTSVGNLFPEILTEIFTFLDIKSKGRCAKVCTKWRDAVYRKSVWKNTEARLHIGRSNPYLYPSLVRRGITRVQVLSLRKSLRELVNGIPQLESLNLSGCYNLSDSALDGAFNKDVPHLKRLNLSLCKEVSDNSLGRIAAHCKNLQELDLGGCAKITNTGLLLISWGLKKISRLNLRSCRLISDAGIGHLCGVDTHSNQGKRSPLVDIGLQDCQKLSDESLRHMAVGMPALEKINLSFCVSVTDSGMKSISQLEHLKDLNLRSCDNVSDIGIGFLAENGSPIARLDVSFCTNVTDGAMKHIAGGLVGLNWLSLTTCAIGDSSLEKLAASLVKLEVLNIGQCLSVSDKGLEYLGKKAKRLTSLDLYGCPKVTKTSLEKLRNDLPQLKQINLDL